LLTQHRTQANSATSKVVAGARFELYSACHLGVPAVPASVFAAR
jgi:hypothetical protein